MFLLHQSQERKRYSKEGERGSERQMSNDTLLEMWFNHFVKIINYANLTLTWP